MNSFTQDMQNAWRLFVENANPTMLHQLDRERFADFVGTAHRARHAEPIDFVRLCRETRDWGPDRHPELYDDLATELGAELQDYYELERSILPDE